MTWLVIFTVLIGWVKQCLWRAQAVHLYPNALWLCYDWVVGVKKAKECVTKHHRTMPNNHPLNPSAFKPMPIISPFSLVRAKVNESSDGNIHLSYRNSVLRK